jgi:hypothetical protein
MNKSNKSDKSDKSIKSTELSDYLDPNVKQLDGPVNVVRLEGTINGVKKVLYVFMDFHIQLGNQSKCDNIFSTDIGKYFAETFYKLNESSKKYDFFFEIHPTEMQFYKYGYNFELPLNYTEMYIYEIFKLFKRLFNYDQNKNKVSFPKIFKNVRLHYVDIRDYFYNSFFDQLSTVGKLTDNLFMQININAMYQIIHILTGLKNNYLFLEDILNSLDKPIDKSKIRIIKQRKPGEPPIEYDESHMRYLLNKIFDKYNNEKVQNVMTDIMNNLKKQIPELIKLIDKSINKITELIKLYTEYENKLFCKQDGCSYGYPRKNIKEAVNEIFDLNETIFDKFVDFYVIIMDVYMLRRFLDKDYITNGISYTGAAHSSHYIYVLIKYFDFNITHLSYSKITDINKLIDTVKNAKSYFDIQELFFPPTRNQCSDITGFPPNFD